MGEARGPQVQVKYINWHWTKESIYLLWMKTLEIGIWRGFFSKERNPLPMHDFVPYNADLISWPLWKHSEGLFPIHPLLNVATTRSSERQWLLYPCLLPTKVPKDALPGTSFVSCNDYMAVWPHLPSCLHVLQWRANGQIRECGPGLELEWNPKVASVFTVVDIEKERGCGRKRQRQIIPAWTRKIEEITDPEWMGLRNAWKTMISWVSFSSSVSIFLSLMVMVGRVFGFRAQK